MWYTVPAEEKNDKHSAAGIYVIIGKMNSLPTLWANYI